MKIGSIQLEKLVVMTVAIISMLMSGCEDRFDSGVGNPAEGGEPVEVNLNIGLADETDGYELSSKASGADHEGAFDCELVPSAQTRSGSSVKPDALYNLEIRQYGSDNACLNTSATVVEKANIGSRITVTLTTAEKCQLVLVAWGDGNSRRLGTAKLDAVKDTIGSYLIKDLKPGDQSDMNKMPYVLHLKDVNVSSDGRLYSNEGEAIDIRLRLKRLAARLTFNWTYSVSGYIPQHIFIHGIPADYKVVASPDKKDNTYPSLLDQYTVIQVPITVSQDASGGYSGSYSCWIPANVRGNNPAVSTAGSRTKANAPTGSAYIRFVSVNDTEAKKKLNYCIYLGGKEAADFNVCENTNYIYNVTFNHEGLPVDDRRVTIVDPIPASDGNSNFVNTANCFMVPPGGAFCFNPYKYYINGEIKENGTLQGWCSNNTRIKSVKVLWQTLENGDLGDPVLGTVNSSADHTNIVDLTDGDSFADARVYCRVAPGTTGGSGLIAAYDDAEGNGNILWSWHIWVTDYSPDATADATILEPANKRVLQCKKDNTAYKPMMDRCLGAYDGYVAVPTSIVGMSRANGFHYQWGRKDPFPGSYTSEELPGRYEFRLDSDRPPKNYLNRYKPDGVTWLIPSGKEMKSVQEAYQNPEKFNDNANTSTWGQTKTEHDPCPAGWRVLVSDEFQILVSYNQAETIFTNSKADGGVLLQYDGTDNRTYMRFSGYPASSSAMNNVGYSIFLASATSNDSGRHNTFIASRDNGPLDNVYKGIKIIDMQNKDAHNIRCIQDR